MSELHFVQMVRNPAEHAAPHAAQVHPDEVDNYRSGGWVLEHEVNWTGSPLPDNAAALIAPDGQTDDASGPAMTTAQLHEAIRALGGAMPANSKKTDLFAKLAELQAAGEA